MRSAFLGSLLALCAALTWVSPARAAGPIGGEGEPIATSDYAIDLFQGPVLASSRTTGLAGAYSALAEGVDGNRTNAAAPAVRYAWSRRWFDYDVSLGLTFPGSLARTDFDNDGRVGFTYEDFYFLTVGANVEFGSWAFGLSIDAQQYALADTGSAVAARRLNLTFQRGHVLLAHAFFDAQLVVGAGLQVGSLEFSADSPQAEEDEFVFGLSSSGAEAGVLWAPIGLPLRLGLSARLPSESETHPESSAVPDAQGDTRVGRFYAPERLQFPWEVETGWAVQLGPRPLNVRWVNPRVELRPLRDAVARARAARKRASPGAAREESDARARLRAARRELAVRRTAAYYALPRRKLLISTSVLLSGPVEDGVGLESFLRQTVQRSGQQATLTPRLGMEVEAIPHYLQVRAGTYIEPSRFALGEPRLHGTAGFDVRVLTFGAFGLAPKDSRWRVGGYLDAARQYLAWGFSAGVWH